MFSPLSRRTFAALLAVSTAAVSGQSPRPTTTQGRAEGPAEGPRPSRLRTASRFDVPSPTTRPLKPAVPFDPARFSYDGTGPSPEATWATPNALQTLVFGRPPAVRGDGPPAATQPAAVAGVLPAPLRMANADLRWFAFRGTGGEWVPGLLATPHGKEGPFPLVIATHGLLSHKMQVVSQVGPDLMDKGFAVVAVDLPLHGERPGWGLDLLDVKDPGRMAGLWTRAVVDLRRALDVALAVPVVDAGKPVTAVGYSLGSWMSVVLGAADERVASMVLMVGGATELPAELLRDPAFASADQRTAIAAFSPRPVLMINAKGDRTVTPEMARRLYGAAREPKEIRWYEMGHILKQPAYREAAEWIAGRVTATEGDGK